MATLVQVEEALEELSKGGPSIPGLDIDAVIKNIVDIQVKSLEGKIYEVADTVEQAKEDIEAMRVQLTEYLSTGDAKAAIKAEIDNIKTSAKAATIAIKEIPTSITKMIAENAIPPMITVPPAPPNPINVGLKVLIARSDFKTIIETIGKILSDLLKSALKIKFEVPNSILAMVNILATLKNTIP
jgi:hypothetical protein